MLFPKDTKGCGTSLSNVSNILIYLFTGTDYVVIFCWLLAWLYKEK